MITSSFNGADDLFAPAATVDEPARVEGFVLCEFAGISVAVPQADIVTIEHGSDLSAPLPGENAIGWFASAQGPWPAYALDAQLDRLSTPSASSSFLVFVKSQPWPAGLMCDSVRIVRARTELQVQPLPAIMRANASTPVCGIARLDERHLALVLAEGGLAAHLGAQIEREVRHE
jgi:hypothetical protein